VLREAEEGPLGGDAGSAGRPAQDVTFAFTLGSYGTGMWLPQILKSQGLSTIAIGWVTAIPYLFATIGMMA
jgi:hypothetical protein